MPPPNNHHQKFKHPLDCIFSQPAFITSANHYLLNPLVSFSSSWIQDNITSHPACRNNLLPEHLLPFSLCVVSSPCRKIPLSLALHREIFLNANNIMSLFLKPSRGFWENTRKTQTHQHLGSPPTLITCTLPLTQQVLSSMGPLPQLFLPP